MPLLAKKCIKSWKRFCPDYIIKEWNEDNFDLDMYPYAREAYNARKFAFVTDVVRLFALYHEGGVYMDTDVEVIKPLDSFLNHIAFSGFENETMVPTGIMASEKGGRWAMENLSYYEHRHFVLEDGSYDMTTNVVTITNYLRKFGLKQNNSFQEISGLITLYPKDFFCPISYSDLTIHKTKDTVTIHHFAGSWHTWDQRLAHKYQNLRKRFPRLYYFFIYLPVRVIKGRPK